MSVLLGVDMRLMLDINHSRSSRLSSFYARSSLETKNDKKFYTDYYDFFLCYQVGLDGARGPLASLASFNIYLNYIFYLNFRVFNLFNLPRCSYG